MKRVSDLSKGMTVLCDRGICEVVWPAQTAGPYTHVRDAAGQGWLRLAEELSPAPVRLQLSRAKGARLSDAMSVARPTRWGNPYRVGPSFTAAEAVAAFREHLVLQLRHVVIRDDLATLRGKNLACWCKPDEPCHADVLLELANGPLPGHATGAHR